MIKTLNSPILQDKYRWQNKEYQKTKQLNTAEYFIYLQKEIGSFIKEIGLKKSKVSDNSFVLTKKES